MVKEVMEEGVKQVIPIGFELGINETGLDQKPPNEDAIATDLH